MLAAAIQTANQDRTLARSFTAASIAREPVSITKPKSVASSVEFYACRHPRQWTFGNVRSSPFPRRKTSAVTPPLSPRVGRGLHFLPEDRPDEIVGALGEWPEILG